MKKRIYRSISVKDVNWSRAAELFQDRRVVVGVDAAKVKMKACVSTSSQEVVMTLKWDHPLESRELVDRLVTLPTSLLEVALEPTGTYGDALRHLFLSKGVCVYRVSTKRVHDAQEVYDGVPSQHDPKCASIVARLHWDSLSELWPARSASERELRSAVSRMQLYDQAVVDQTNRLEAQLARYWPELPHQLGLRTLTLQELLAVYGGPQGVAEDPEGAMDLMRQVARGLRKTTVKGVLEGALNSVGVPMTESERELLQELVSERRRSQALADEAGGRVESLVAGLAPASRMADVIGLRTAGVLVSALGVPGRYACARSYQKSLGLNLRIHSSGQRKIGQLMITKRGPGAPRNDLYWAVLRLIQEDRIMQAWYQRKVARDGDKLKLKAVVAVMRKLSLALWHVSQGARFDASQLFDVRRLDLDLPSAA